MGCCSSAIESSSGSGGACRGRKKARAAPYLSRGRLGSTRPCCSPPPAMRRGARDRNPAVPNAVPPRGLPFVVFAAGVGGPDQEDLMRGYLAKGFGEAGALVGRSPDAQLPVRR